MHTYIFTYTPTDNKHNAIAVLTEDPDTIIIGLRTMAKTAWISPGECLCTPILLFRVSVRR